MLVWPIIGDSMSDDLQTILSLIKERRSIRRFRPEPIPAKTIETLLEAARWAPSAGNRQAWRFWVVTDAATRQAMGTAVEQTLLSIRDNLRDEARAEANDYLSNFGHFANAPVVIAPIHRGGTELLQASQEHDPLGPARAEADALCSVAAAIQNMLLAAHAQGLGACWMTGPLVAHEALAQVLQLPEGWSLSALIPIGWPAESPGPTSRRALARLVRHLD
jgi:coenzyme F420-0:L-glutamate ligase/coenzyme F420-1:gamma-L-glutamate ligase